MNASSQREDPLSDFPAVIVKTDGFDCVGMLFSDNDRCVILVNNVNEGGDYGPLRHFRDEHLTPECNVTVLPKTIVREICTISAAHDSD